MLGQWAQLWASDVLAKYPSNQTIQSSGEALMRAIQNLTGESWQNTLPSGRLWQAIEDYGGLWVAVEIYGWLQGAMGNYGGLWGAVSSYGKLWVPMARCG